MSVVILILMKRRIRDGAVDEIEEIEEKNNQAAKELKQLSTAISDNDEHYLPYEFAMRFAEEQLPEEQLPEEQLPEEQLPDESLDDDEIDDDETLLPFQREFFSFKRGDIIL